MFRVVNIVMVSLAIGVACLSYAIKYDTQGKGDRLDTLNRNISLEMEGLRVTNVEWNYLTRPERLKSLADKRPDLQTMSLSQIVAADEIAARVPFKVEAEIGEAVDAFGELPRPKPTNTNEGTRP